MAKTKRKKRKRKPTASQKEKQTSVAPTGGVMQSMRSGFKRAVTGDHEQTQKSSTVSNVIWGIILVGALALLAYRML